MTDITTVQLHQHFRRQQFASIAAFERAEDVFADITAQYLANADDRVVGELMAAGDRLRRASQGDAAYFMARASMYGLGFQTLWLPQLGSLPGVVRLLGELVHPRLSDVDLDDLHDAHPAVTAATEGYPVGGRASCRRSP
jgi:hypothetical protein